jgi:thiamine-monophosphate kinase
MCRVSQVTATVEVARVPLSEATRRALAAEPGLLDAILTGGDDYEVVASIAESEVGNLAAEGAAAGVTTTVIGTVGGGDGKARFLGRDGTELAFVRPSFSHF